MSAEDNFRRVRSALNAGRNVLTTLGYRTIRVFVVTRVWEGGRKSADGGFVDQAVYGGQVVDQATGRFGDPPQVGLEIVPRPKVRTLGIRETYGSGGIFREGDVRLTYIQPWWEDSRTGVRKGFRVVDVAPDPAPSDGIETYYYLTGDPLQGEYFRVGSLTEKFGHFEVTLRARATTPTVDAAGT